MNGFAAKICSDLKKGRTLLGAVDELDAVLQELARHVEHLLHLVGHCEDGGGMRMGLWWVVLKALREIDGVPKEVSLSLLVRKQLVGGLNSRASRKLGSCQFASGLAVPNVPHRLNDPGLGDSASGSCAGSGADLGRKAGRKLDGLGEILLPEF